MFTVAAGVLFGSVLGVLLAVAGTTLAAVAAFWLVRLVAGPFVERHAHRAGIAWVRRRLARNGLLAVASLRLIPMVPFAVLNYAAGLSGVRFVPYVLGTVIGILPGTVAVVVLGDAAIGGGRRGGRGPGGAPARVGARLTRDVPAAGFEPALAAF
ncbi:MAG: VTT domain-containing protein [Pseudonocardiales bacterium]|nr:VTT domain-containing protein [Pseudonocardiales bacterium]